MSRISNNFLKLTLSFVFVFISLCIVLFGLYFYYFSPKVEVKALNSQITIDKKILIKKFLPSDFKLTFKEISVESTTEFFEDELTDLFILSINETPNLSNIIEGLKVDIEDSNINVYFHMNYKKIPLEGKITFTAECKDSKGVFHYKGGSIGFIPIKKEYIFSQLEPTSIIQLDKGNGDILLSFDEIKQLEIKDVSIENDKIKFKFKGTINFWDWLEN